MANFVESIIKLMKSTDPKLFAVISNPHRSQMLEFLEKKDKLSISDFWKGLGGKEFMSYKSFYNNVQVLENANLIKLTKDMKSSGQAVIVECAFK